MVVVWVQQKQHLRVIQEYKLFYAISHALHYDVQWCFPMHIVTCKPFFLFRFLLMKQVEKAKSEWTPYQQVTIFSFSFSKKVNKSTLANLAEHNMHSGTSLIYTKLEDNCSLQFVWGFNNLLLPALALVYVMHCICLLRSIGKPSSKSHWIYREDDRVFLCQCTTAEGTTGRLNFHLSFISILPAWKGKKGGFLLYFLWKLLALHINRWSGKHGSIPCVSFGISNHWLNCLRWQWDQHNGTCTWQPSFIHMSTFQLNMVQLGLNRSSTCKAVKFWN